MKFTTQKSERGTFAQFAVIDESRASYHVVRRCGMWHAMRVKIGQSVEMVRLGQFPFSGQARAACFAHLQNT